MLQCYMGNSVESVTMLYLLQGNLFVFQSTEITSLSKF